jgi:putative NIF3 family GTP cyclohydrolase 1 type 2
MERRQFVSSVLKVAGASTLLTLPGTSFAKVLFSGKVPMTVQQVIDLILKSIPGAPFGQTVDTIKAGDPSQIVRGIVTTMFATADVIKQAARLGANFIIVHEPTFYGHTDETAWLNDHPVYQYKKKLLEKNGMVVWRFHDYIHAHRPDGVLMGVLTALGWENYYKADNPGLVTIPVTTLQQIITLVKEKLHIPHVKVIGTMTERCSRIMLLPGAAGGHVQMEALVKEKPDLMLVGELQEWETSEYIRDLRDMGAKTALVVLGHIQSEEPGLEWLKNWLQPQLQGIKVTHIPTTSAFQWA